jgi:hypothetical protein
VPPKLLRRTSCAAPVLSAAPPALYHGIAVVNSSHHCRPTPPVLSFPNHTAGFSTASISLCSENMIKKMMMIERKEGKTTE